MNSKQDPQNTEKGKPADEPFDLMKADFDDIVFQHRNKAYGAYYLRRNYRWNKIKGFLLSVFLLLLLVYFDKIVHLFDGQDYEVEEKNVVVELTNVESEKPVLPPPPPPPPPPKKNKAQPKPTKKPKPKEEEPLLDETKLPNLNDKPDEVAATETDTLTADTSGKADGEPGGEIEKPKPEVPPSGPIVKLAEQMPSFPGGEVAMLRFIYQHFKYPDAAREAGIVGKVYITFIVEKDGSISKIEIKEDIGGGCGKEAARIVRMMPKWVPGKTENKVVRVQMTLPFEFNLLD